MAFHLYTRTGDAGQTSLVGGQRVEKCCDRLEAYGTVDELNSHIGLLLCDVEDAAERAALTQIQNRLFVVGSHLATDLSTTELHAASVVTEQMVSDVERRIDALEQAVPPLHAFVLPAGCRGAAQAHVCRTVCRRAERRILALSKEAKVDALVLAYVNRLSDYFFALARALNTAAGREDVCWEPG